jgi:hypothetical protein
MCYYIMWSYIFFKQVFSIVGINWKLSKVFNEVTLKELTECCGIATLMELIVGLNL